MGTFENPVWTVSDVGGIYLLFVILALWLAYQLIFAAKDALSDIVKIIKSNLSTWKSLQK